MHARNHKDTCTHRHTEALTTHAGPSGTAYTHATQCTRRYTRRNTRKCTTNSSARRSPSALHRVSLSACARSTDVDHVSLSSQRKDRFFTPSDRCSSHTATCYALKETERETWVKLLSRFGRPLYTSKVSKFLSV